MSVGWAAVDDEAPRLEGCKKDGLVAEFGSVEGNVGCEYE